MDEDGYLFFKSRSKDLIIRGGANLYPAEIEGFLATHPSIGDVQVFGVPDERMGEEVCDRIIILFRTFILSLVSFLKKSFVLQYLSCHRTISYSIILKIKLTILIFVFAHRQNFTLQPCFVQNCLRFSFVLLLVSLIT